jgi:hypothetical protein
MASLKDPQRMTENLRTRADELHTQVVDGEADLATIVRLADELGGAADRVATTFDKVNEALEQQGEEGEGGEARPSRELAAALTPASAGEQDSESGEARSSERIYRRAREADIEIPGQAGMSRDEPS